MQASVTLPKVAEKSAPRRMAGWAADAGHQVGLLLKGDSGLLATGATYTHGWPQAVASGAPGLGQATRWRCTPPTARRLVIRLRSRTDRVQ